MITVIVKHARGKEILSGDVVVLSIRDGLVVASVDGEPKAIFYADDVTDVIISSESGDYE